MPDSPDLLPPALDPQAALARVGGNRGLLAELAGLFLEDSARWLAEIAGGLARGDAAGVQFTAHLLRGSAASFGAQGTSRAARDLEEAARAGDLRLAAAQAPVLEACLRGLRPALADLARAAAEARA
jgi:HPt (histidine-containing phosphotransfer) domain-containing protein